MLTIPQTALIALNVYAVCVHIFKNGRQKTPNNFYIQSVGWLFEVYVLNTTAFFDHFGIPQSVWVLLSAVGLVGSAMKHGKVRQGDSYSGPMALLAFGVLMTIYYFGGFFN